MLRAIPPLHDRESRARTVRGQYGPARRGQAGARLPRGGGRRPATRTPRPTWRSSSASTTGAGPACRSTCAPASGCPSAPPRSPSSSSGRRYLLFEHEADDASIAAERARRCASSPNEGITLRFDGQGARRRRCTCAPVNMDFRYGSLVRRRAARGLRAAAARLHARRPDALHPHRRDRDCLATGGYYRSWVSSLNTPIVQYEPGTWGPKEADALIERDGRTWRRL